jgi:LCP family protein required for cell wall assembly
MLKLKQGKTLCKKFYKIICQNFVTGLLLGAGAIAVAGLLSLCILLFKLKQEYRQFLSAADLTHPELKQIVSDALEQHNQFVQKQIQLQSQTQDQSQALNTNFLLLGVDQVANRGGDPLLTDTMLLLNLDPKQQQVTALSLPRDLWLEAYKTKINALYTYGQDRFPQQPEKFPTRVISNLTQIPIDYTVVLSLSQLAELIDLVGGIQVNVPQAFVDREFPRSDVNLEEVTDPEQLYTTVEFRAGKQTMQAERALQYIRSRHSQNEQGTDLARGQRQQQVIQALLGKLTQPQLYLQQPSLAAALIRYYQNNFAQYVPLADALALGLNLSGIGRIKQQAAVSELTRTPKPSLPELQFESVSLPVYPEENAVLYHPPQATFYQQQWVYTIHDKQKFAEYVGTALE